MMMTLTKDVPMRQIIVQELRQKVQALEAKVEELDTFSDTVNTQMNIFNELLAIMREFSAGRKIYNRAVNRVELKNLRLNILVRRKKALTEIRLEKKMPEPIKEGFIKKQLKMIAQTLKHIKHRTKFEERSAKAIYELDKKDVFKKISH